MVLEPLPDEAPLVAGALGALLVPALLPAAAPSIVKRESSVLVAMLLLATSCAPPATVSDDVTVQFRYSRFVPEASP